MQFWHAVACKTKKGEQDNAESQLINQGFEVYNPKISIKTIKKGISLETIESVFPGYLFVKYDPLIQSTSTINYTRGVQKVLMFGSCLAKIQDEIIDDLKLRFAKEAPEFNRHPERGDEVEVNKGPMTGLKLIYQEPDGKARSFLLVELLGNSQTISIKNSSFK